MWKKADGGWKVDFEKFKFIKFAIIMHRMNFLLHCLRINCKIEINSHCVIYSKVHRHCKQVRRFDSFSTMLWLLSYNLHRMYLHDVLHSVAIVVSIKKRRKIFKLIKIKRWWWGGAKRYQQSNLMIIWDSYE